MVAPLSQAALNDWSGSPPNNASSDIDYAKFKGRRASSEFAPQGSGPPEPN